MLLELWALGLMSALVLQSIAAAACRVAPRLPMEALASMGASGGHKGEHAPGVGKESESGTLG